MIELDYWLFKPEAWIIFGVALIILDVLVGLNFFVLPVGVAGLIIAATLFVDQTIWPDERILMADWRTVAIVFAVLSLAAIYFIKRAFKRSVDEQPDINQY